MEKTKVKEKSINYPKVGLKDVLRTFWNGIKPRKWYLFAMILFAILASIVSIIIPIFYKQFFDVISSSLTKEEITPQLFSIVFWVLFLNGIYWTLYRLATIAVNYFEPKVMANLKQQAYDHLMQHSYSFFVNNFAGSLVQKINRFAKAFERITDNLVWNLLPLVVRVVSIIIVVFFINKWIALIILIWTFIFLLFNIIFSRWKLKYDIKAAAIDSVATGYLSDTISNQNAIQLFNGFNFESDGYKKVTNDQVKITVFSWNLDAVIEAGQSFLSFAIEFVLFYFAIKYWDQGLITIGVFVLLQTYVLSIIHQLWGFTRVVRDLYQGYADSKEMVEIMLLSHEIKDVPNVKDLLLNDGKIEFKNITFGFNKERHILKNLNLIVKPGEKVALIGPSGAGKTTFVRLLLRMYSATSGEILIDGQDISQATQGSLRRNISMVPQDPILFHRTLAENIAYGKRTATKEEIEKAAKLAHCDEFIKDLPNGLETFVGERGIKLSGGERQRVAIARAILKNAPILILDEATSSLDSNSEMLIQDALNNLMKGKTTIVIAHRLSTIQKMDRIIVIDDGKIIEQGNHSELLTNKNSLYKKLWDLQAGGFLKETGDESLSVAQDNLDDSDGDDDNEEDAGTKSQVQTKSKLVNF